MNANESFPLGFAEDYRYDRRCIDNYHFGKPVESHSRDRMRQADRRLGRFAPILPSCARRGRARDFAGEPIDRALDDGGLGQPHRPRLTTVRPWRQDAFANPAMPPLDEEILM